MNIRLLVALFALLVPSLISALDTKISINAQFTPYEDYHIRGALLVKHAKSDRGRVCFYLPLNDPDVEYNPLKRFNLFQDKYSARRRQAGEIQITNIVGGFIDHSITPEKNGVMIAIKLDLKDNLLVRFKTKLPRWINSDPEQFQAIHFHPIPMNKCVEEKKAAFQTNLKSQFRLKMRYPSDWIVASNATEQLVQKSIGPFAERRYEKIGESISLSFGKNFQRKLIKQQDFYLEMFYSSQDFLSLVEPLMDLLSYHRKLFGVYPFKKLAIVESSELENSEIPGMIVINQPKNQTSAGVQQFFTNWTVWQLAYFTSEQWFGAAIKYRSMDDYWLFKGINDFAAYRALKRAKEGFDFFRAYGNRVPRFTFSYRQNQDLMAALLTFFQNKNALVDKQIRSRMLAEKQHPLTYVRHSLALRQIEWALGTDKLSSVFKDIVGGRLNQRISPKDFRNFNFQGLTGFDRSVYQDYLDQWWLKSEWPDFYLQSVKESKVEGDIYKVVVQAKESNGYRLPLSVEVIDKNGNSEEKRASPNKFGVWESTFHLKSPLDRVYLDPDRETFDWNRFNNSRRWAKWMFFPGSARTLYDEDYNIVWLPMVGKLPGDSLTLYLSAQFLRYIHDGVTAIVNYSPESKKAGAFLMHEAVLPKLGGYSLFSIEQDSPINRDERIVEWEVVKSPFLLTSPVMRIGVLAKHRKLINVKNSGHEVVGIELGLRPINRNLCNYDLELKGEKTVSARSKDIEYTRNYSLFDGNCQVSRSVDISLRAFTGSLFGNEEFLPENVFFRPQNVSEARIRIPNPRLNPVQDLSSASLDLLIPADLGIGGIALTKQIRWRLFYDYGRSFKNETTYRDAGFGIYMPLGGSVVGKGGISLLRFSLLYVPYAKVDGDKSGGNGVLFDFFGNL